MRSRAQHKCFVTGRGRNSIRKNSNVKEVVECLFFIYMLILYHPKVYNMFHPMVPPHGPTLRSHPRVQPQGLGSWVLPQGLGPTFPVCPRGWRKFVKSNARPSRPYTLRPGNFFRKITKELSVDWARDSWKVPKNLQGAQNQIWSTEKNRN